MTLKKPKEFISEYGMMS